MSTSSLRRRIVFYGWEDVDGFEPFDRRQAARGMADLAEDDWAFVEDDFVTAVIVDRVGNATAPTCLRCFRLRAGDDIPHVMTRARVTSRLPLRTGEAVTDWTHVVIWADNYAAHDARRDAPALSRLSRYIREQVAERVRFYPLYDRTLVDQLEELDEIKAIDIKIELSRTDQVARARRGGLFGGLVGLGEEMDALTISTKVSVGHDRHHFLSRRAHREVLGLAGNAEEVLDNLVVTGLKDGQTVYIDVLKQRLEEAVSIARSRTLGNAPEPSAMYERIIAARRELERTNRLQRAARLR